MDSDIKKIYDTLPAADRAAIRKALQENDLITINAYKRAAAGSVVPDDIPQKETIKEKRPQGRPALGLREKHIKQHNEDIKQLRTLNNINEVVEAGPEAGDLDQFKNDYNQIINNVCNDFYLMHEDLVKKTPVFWYNSLFYEIKKELPSISYKDPDRVAVAWDCFTGLMFKIGLFPTMEAFTALTGVYKYQLEKMLSPEYIQLKTKIYNDCKDHMIAQVGYNPMTQVNKMFLLKSVYGLNEGSPAQVVQADSNNKNIDDIPVFLIDDKSENL